MNTDQQQVTADMMNKPTSRWMACSATAPRHEANQADQTNSASFERQNCFDRQDQRPTRFPTSPTEMSNRESAFYFANEER
jgi:hypothetical protein